MQLEFKFKAGTDEVVIYHGDEKVGVFSSTSLIRDLGQAHVQAELNNVDTTLRYEGKKKLTTLT